MGYMIAIRKESTENQFMPILVAYTGEKHDTKQKALEEYLEAAGDPDVIGMPYIVIV